MRCPSCGLENPNSAIKCDCGHRFAGSPEDRLLAEVSAIGRRVESIRKAVLLFVVITLGAAIIAGLIAAFEAAR